MLDARHVGRRRPTTDGNQNILGSVIFPRHFDGVFVNNHPAPIKNIYVVFT